MDRSWFGPRRRRGGLTIHLVIGITAILITVGVLVDTGRMTVARHRDQLIADADSGSPPIANAVPVGRPVRARVVAWPHRMVTGTYFSWLPGVSGANFLMSANEAAIRE